MAGPHRRASRVGPLGLDLELLLYLVLLFIFPFFLLFFYHFMVSRAIVSEVGSQHA